MITFRYKQSGKQTWQSLSVRAQEFLRRFLQHVLPKGLQRVRYYGWLSAAAHKKCQRILAPPAWPAPGNGPPRFTPPASLPWLPGALAVDRHSQPRSPLARMLILLPPRP